MSNERMAAVVLSKRTTSARASGGVARPVETRGFAGSRSR